MNEELRRCPNCGAYVLSSDDICPRCDYRLHDVPALDADTLIGTEPQAEPVDEEDAAPAAETVLEPGVEAAPEAELAPEGDVEPGVEAAPEAELAPEGDVEPGAEAIPEAELAPEGDVQPGAEAVPADRAQLPTTPLPQVKPIFGTTTPAHLEAPAAGRIEPEAATWVAPEEDDAPASDMAGTQPRLSGQLHAPAGDMPTVRTTTHMPPAGYIVPPAPYTPPPRRVAPPAQIAPPAPAYNTYAAPRAAAGAAYLQQRIQAYLWGGYRVLIHGPYEATLASGKRLGAGGWLLALLSIIGVLWYLLILALSGFQADKVYIVLESDGRVYEDGPGAAHVREGRARTGRRWGLFGLIVFFVCLLLASVLAVIGGVVLTQTRYQAALREAYPTVTLLEERFSDAEAAPDDVALVRDGAVAYAVLAGVALVGLWGGATLFVIGTIHAGAYQTRVPPLPGWG